MPVAHLCLAVSMGQLSYRAARLCAFDPESRLGRIYDAILQGNAPRSDATCQRWWPPGLGDASLQRPSPDEARRKANDEGRARDYSEHRPDHLCHDGRVFAIELPTGQLTLGLIDACLSLQLLELVSLFIEIILWQS